VLARASERVYMHFNKAGLVRLTRSYRPAKGAIPPSPPSPSLISSSPPTLFLSLRLSLLTGGSAVARYSRCCLGIIRDTGPRRQRWRSQVRASAERSAACAAGDLPERSLDGGEVRGAGRAGHGGAEGSRRREGIPRTRAAERLRTAAAQKPLEPVLREFFYARPWFSSRGTCRRDSLLKDDSSSCSYREYLKYFLELKVTNKKKKKNFFRIRHCFEKIYRDISMLQLI